MNLEELASYQVSLFAIPLQLGKSFIKAHHEVLTVVLLSEDLNMFFHEISERDSGKE